MPSIQAIGMPEDELFNLVSEYNAGDFIYSRTFNGIARSDHLVVVEMTMRRGRSDAMKKALYVSFADHFAQLQARKIAVPELLGEMVGERVLDAIVVQDGGMEVGREQRLFRRGLHRLDAQLRPHAA